jgi:integrase
MASITKRGPAQYQAMVRRKGYPRTIKTFETKFDAEAWARQVEGEMDRGIFVSRVEAEKTTLGEALNRYLEVYVPRLAQERRERARVRFLQRRALASRFLASIRGRDVADFIQERTAEGVGANTIRLDLATISRVFAIAATDWGMESLSNPVRKVNKPKAPSGRTRRLEGDEESRLLDTCTLPFKRVVRFALETAMRREEISSLIWANVDLKNRSVFLPKTKNGEARTVPLSPTAISILIEIDGEHAGSVFGMSYDAIGQAMQKARKAADIENLTFHDLRHEATSRLFENTDLDVMEIKFITGHRSMQMLARYSHLRTARLADRLAGARRGGNIS